MSILLEHCKDLYILNEAYYGKPREFVEIEKRLDKLIEKIHQLYELKDYTTDINDSKELREIEDIFTKFFNNYMTSISFYAPFSKSITNNIFTIPSSLSYFRKDPNDKRIARSEDLFINVNIDIGMVYYCNLTSEELMSLILHEIGHCYDASLFSFLSNFTISIASKIENDSLDIKYKDLIVGNISSFLMKAFPPAVALFQFINKLTTKIPVLSLVLSLGFSAYTSIYGAYNKIRLFRFGVHPLEYVKSLIDPQNIFGYAGEKFADSFATSYGYGKALIQVMDKFDQGKHKIVDTVAREIPILNIGYDFVKVSTELMTIVLDPHPSYASRIQNQINKLKIDLNDPNLDPKVKKELLNNLKDMEDYIDNEVLNIKSDSNKGRLISLIQNYIIIKIFNGKIDPRELFEVVWNHER